MTYDNNTSEIKIIIMIRIMIMMKAISLLNIIKIKPREINMTIIPVVLMILMIIRQYYLIK